MIPISLVIPTFNGINLLKKNLGAALSCLRNKDELIIIDDASTDESIDYLQNIFRLSLSYENKQACVYHGVYQQEEQKIEVIVIKNFSNLRFARSVNRAVQFISNRYFLLLNNDVKPSKDILKYLLPYFNDPKVFAVSMLELGDNQGHNKSGKNKLWFEKGLFIHSKADNFKAGETAWACGGSSIFAKNIWLQLGGFDSAFYPAYWEDIDISYRAKKKGFKIFFEPRAVVYHKHESTNIDTFGEKRIKKMSLINANKFVLKNATIWQLLQFFLYRPYWWYQYLKRF